MNDLRSRYEQWERARNRYSAQEESGAPLPSSNEWEWSDDEAVDLLHEAMQALQSANTMLHGQREVTNSLDELVRTLTTHADAMRALILDLDCEIDQTGEAANMGRYSYNERAIAKVIAAYDAFIKEA